MQTNEAHKTEEGVAAKLTDSMLRIETPLQFVSIVIHFYHRLS